MGSGPGSDGDGERVGVHDLEAVGEVGPLALDRGGQSLGEHVVDLDRDDALHVRQQREGERAEAGADLDDDVVGLELGGADDAPHGVAVDDEVLAALLGGTYAEPLREQTDLGGAQQPVALALVAHGATARCRRTENRSRSVPSGSASAATASHAADCAASRSPSGTRSQIARAPADQVQSSHCCTSR